MGGRADERVAQRPQEACLVHGASGEGDRLLGGVLGRGHHRKAAHPRRLETLPLGGTTIPPTMTPIDGSSKSTFGCENPRRHRQLLLPASYALTAALLGLTQRPKLHATSFVIIIEPVCCTHSGRRKHESPQL